MADKITSTVVVPSTEGDSTSTQSASSVAQAAKAKSVTNITKLTGQGSTGQFSADTVNTDSDLSNANLTNVIREIENPLLKYHNSTYHFKLYAISPDDFAVFLENDNEGISKVVIAESGVTGRYSLNNVKMVGVAPGTPGLSANYGINTFTIEMSEQNGNHLYDDIVVMSNLLGYKKFCDVPIVLELDFIGFDQDTGVPTVIPGHNKKWGLLINNITTTADKSGGTMHHTITAAPITSITSDAMWVLKEPLEMTVSSFGQAISELQKKLNEMGEQQYGYLRRYLPAISNGMYYEFFMSDELKNLMMQGSGGTASTVNNDPKGGPGVKKFSWKADTTLGTVIDDILDTCYPVQPKSGNEEAPIRVAVNVVPTVFYCGYDPVLENNVYKYKVYILKYKIGDVLSERDLDEARFSDQYFIQNAEKVNDPQSGDLKLNAKIYNYQFSGLNTEILDLDIKFDSQFMMAVARNPDGMRDPSNGSGAYSADDTVSYGDKVYNVESQQSYSEMWAARTKIVQTAQKENRQLTDSEQQFVRDVDNVTPPNMEGESQQQSTAATSPTTTPSYIEDYRNVYDLTEMGTDGSTGNTSTATASEQKKVTVPQERTNTGSDSSSTVNDSEDPSDQLRRMCRDNYYNRSFMQSVSMKVKGDPYWLGWGQYSMYRYLQDLADGKTISYQNNDIDFANFLTTESYFLLNLKPVVSISDDTGLMDYTEPSVFSESLYRVNSVTHEFTEGKFQQTLEAAIIIRALNKTDTTTGNQTNTSTVSSNGVSSSAVRTPTVAGSTSSIKK